MAKGCRNIIAAAFIAAVAACAKPGSPSGGPRDTTPPEVLKTLPANRTTGFTGKSLTITFDEFVVLDKINDKFMISPPVTKRPEIVLKGKNLVITIDETLRDSTTYTLYFQDAIRDLNESNVLENYQFVFSTGSYIDSLSLAGTVADAFSLEVPERMLVMLHSNLSDSAPLKIIPDYISMTDQTGYFSVSNLRAGRYRLFALKDDNSNRKYEAGDEQFAFAGEIIEITAENNSPILEEEHDHEEDTTHSHVHRREPDVSLYSFLSARTRHYLVTSSRRQARLLEYVFSVPSDTPNFVFNAAGVGPEGYFTEASRGFDTIRIWLKDSTIYNQPTIETVITFPFTDVNDSLVLRTDTVPMRFIQPRAPRGGARERPISLQSNANRAGIPPGRDIKIVPDVPLLSVDFPDFSLTRANDTTGTQLAFSHFFDPLVPREIIIRHSLQEGSDYRLEIPPGALKSIYGETNDSASFSFGVRTAASYGTLTIRLSGYEGAVVLQLLNSGEKVIMEEQVDSPGKTEFRFIDNGKYRIKVIYDTDGNGAWTPGNFVTGRQPESVSFFPEELDIKSNWDMEQDWEIGEKNKKAENLRLKKPPQIITR